MREPPGMRDRLAVRLTMAGQVADGHLEDIAVRLLERDVRGIVKSWPTSGPLTVSSQVIQAPHGIRPPEQFIIVPLRLVKARTTSPVGLTWTVVVPPPAASS